MNGPRDHFPLPVPVSPRINIVTSVAAYGFHQLQNTFQAHAFANNFFKSGIAVQLFFQILFLQLTASQSFFRLCFLREVSYDAEYNLSILCFCRA